MDGVLVTGTDCRVPTTLVATALIRSRPGAVYVKPIQTGLADHPADVDVVGGATGCEVRQGRALPHALAPAAAARAAGVAVRRGDLLAPFNGLDTVVGQGEYGLLAALGTDGTTLADLAVDLGLPLAIACRQGKDLLNHARLTLEAAWARGIQVVGLVVTGWTAQPDDAVEEDLQQLTAMARVLALLPELEGLPPRELPAVPW